MRTAFNWSPRYFPIFNFENISMKGPQNRRSLGCARDDKGKGSVSIESGCRTEAFSITLDGSAAGHRPMSTPVGMTRRGRRFHERSVA
ncbi:MAG: hypothetical protein QOH35_107 [Acidobacteriaceae bacterium]|jgi:hypothetical protein|nr:hypothetical protein [Acidobacteriaceae bacterium]MEA2260969.1 hypothetical protein [Acidobacteriaceae bacterium]MEA2538741.1 hypothetical protein [Acidobacteriaceae bacterium]